jgi:membrane protease subunit (stomatin/prohibitin family)
MAMRRIRRCVEGRPRVPYLSSDTLAYRFERYQNEIKYGAKLVVREGQMAAFIDEGKLADVFKRRALLH